MAGERLAREEGGRVDGVILAAGLGTRLRPFTDRAPKALLEVGGVAMLERVARRLVAAGADRLVVNLHPFPEQVRAFVAARGSFGTEVLFSEEREGPLETGGAILKARDLLRRDGPFVVHNVDVLTDLPIEDLLRRHRATRPLATLAVAERASSRALLFDEAGLLGRVDRTRGIDLRVRAPRGEVTSLAFAGIHAVDPSFLDRIEERGAFSVLVPYLRLAAEGASILPYRADAWRWCDVGRSADLTAAEELARALDGSPSGGRARAG